VIREVLLASASPRRRALLEAAGWAVTVRPSDIDESRPAGVAPVDHALALALGKAAAAPRAERLVAADTVVHRGEVMFDKPVDREQAVAHLLALAGGWHQVTTGVCVEVRGERRVFPVTTEVRFRALTPEDVRRYVATGEADDKAGAYGIQGLGGALVAELRGSYTNVVGLPLEETIAALGPADPQR
jgi:septum formation protein